MSRKTAIYGAFAVLVVCLVSFIAGSVNGRRMGWQKGYEEGWNAPHPADTEWVEREVYVDKPVPVEVIPAGVEMCPIGTVAEMRARIDSLLNLKPDTAFVEIPVPIEAKLYKDSLYEAQVSGWHPSLDWVKIKEKTAYISVPYPEYRYPTFAVSPFAECLILPESYGIGAGLELDFWINRWEVSGGCGYYLSGKSGGVFGEVKLKYNLLRR